MVPYRAYTKASCGQRKIYNRASACQTCHIGASADAIELLGGGMNHTPELICYCFNYTLEDIHQDYETNGHSTILEQIKRERTSGNLACAEKNPKGR